jgi:hypothetical protein
MKKAFRPPGREAFVMLVLEQTPWRPGAGLDPPKMEIPARNRKDFPVDEPGGFV